MNLDALRKLSQEATEAISRIVDDPWTRFKFGPRAVREAKVALNDLGTVRDELIAAVEDYAAGIRAEDSDALAALKTKLGEQP